MNVCVKERERGGERKGEQGKERGGEREHIHRCRQRRGVKESQAGKQRREALNVEDVHSQ